MEKSQTVLKIINERHEIKVEGGGVSENNSCKSFVNFWVFLCTVIPLA